MNDWYFSKPLSDDAFLCSKSQHPVSLRNSNLLSKPPPPWPHSFCFSAVSNPHLFKVSFLPLLLLLFLKLLSLYSKRTFPLDISKTHLGGPRLTSLQNRVTWNAFLLDCHVSHALISSWSPFKCCLVKEVTAYSIEKSQSLLLNPKLREISWKVGERLSGLDV